MIKNPFTPSSTPKIERIRTFDLLRGWFLIAILLNHLAYYPSGGLEFLTGRSMLYVSYAEGFFLVSGIMLGIVRGRKLIMQAFSKSAKLLLKRSLQLYVEACLLTILFTFIGWFFIDTPGLKYGIASPETSLLEIVWNTITLQYSYGWADFLRHYAIFLAGAPLVIWLLRRGLWLIVAAISIIIWNLYPVSLGETQGELFLPISWQIIFYSGMIIGFYWPELIKFWHKTFSQRVQSYIRIALFTTFIFTAAVNIFIIFGARFWDIDSMKSIDQILGVLFEKDRLPWRRILLGAVWFWGLFAMVRHYENKIVKWVGKILEPLGSNSLYVYTIEAFIVFFAHLLISPAQPYDQLLPWELNLILSIAAIGLVWLAVKKEFLFKIIPR